MISLCPRLLSGLAAVALWVGCSDSPSGPVDDPGLEPETGTLEVVVDGLPAETDAPLLVTGPDGFSRELAASETLTELVPGTYTASVGEVSADDLTYNSDRVFHYAEVEAGAVATLTVEFRPFNLTVESFYVIQSVQKPTGEIPLVAGRDAYLRVFARANNPNTVRVPVEVRLFRDDELTETWTVPGPTGSAPTEIVEGNLSTSWNLMIPGASLQPGSSIEIEIDPENAIREGDETDNLSPADGGPKALDVRAVRPLEIVLVPIRQPNGSIGNVTEANAEDYLVDLRRMFPIAELRWRIREPYQASTNLRPDEGWIPVLEGLESLRIGDGNSGEYYFGVAEIDYGSGIYGIAYRPGKSALGNDYLDTRNLNASMTLAHELGHSMGRPHSQCGSAGFPDVEYPHANGQIGSYGLDLTSLRVYAPTTKDLMGYCEDRWVGDYTYEQLLVHRLENEAPAESVQQSLVVRGRLGPDGLTLEPAYQVDTRPELPRGTGSYRLEGFDASGRSLFSFTFQAAEIADSPAAQEAFSFALPIDMVQADRLAELRVTRGGMRAVQPIPGP
ncbi:MAG: hypothetical protein GEU90_08895 [Gemmatimonas sp.]|nr:hypothetical protein [Gemmatimonas sp.]